MEQRRARVQTLLGEGHTVKQIAAIVNVHRNTVHTDLASLNLTSFSCISDHNLDEVVSTEYLSAHLAIGTTALESRLQSLGHRIQRKRVRESRGRLGVVGVPPKRIKRLAWYEARGPDGKAS